MSCFDSGLEYTYFSIGAMGGLRFGVRADEGRAPRKLDEALIERQVVPYRVLPAFFVLLVVGELLANELVDLGQSEALVRRRLDRHADQGDVRVGRLFSVRIVSTVVRRLLIMI